jgi:hypothetical protein
VDTNTYVKLERYHRTGWDDNEGKPGDGSVDWLGYGIFVTFIIAISIGLLVFLRDKRVNGSRYKSITFSKRLK